MVNVMVNVCYLTGIVRHKDKCGTEFFVVQSDKSSADIPVCIGNNMTIPPNGSFRTIKGRVVGDTNMYGHTICVECKRISVASALSIDPLSAFTGSLIGRLVEEKSEESPYNLTGLIRASVLDEIKKDKLTKEQMAVLSLYEQRKEHAKRKVYNYHNIVKVSGVVASISYVPGNQHDRYGQVFILLKHDINDEQCLPVCFVGRTVPDVLRKIERGTFVQIMGALKRKCVVVPQTGETLVDVVMIETRSIRIVNSLQDVVAVA